jgi:hypothetical protein
MENIGRLTPDEFWDQFTRTEQQINATFGQLPVFGLDGWAGPVSLGEWDLGSRPPMTVSVMHGTPGNGPGLQVWTTRQDPRHTVVLYRVMANGPAEDEAEFAARQQRLDAEQGEQIRIRVDGEPEPFTLWDDPGRWWAAGRHHGHGIILDGRDIDPGTVALHEVHDLDPYLAGTRTLIRTLRGDL